MTELPYNVGPERIIDRIKDAVQAKKLEGISDVVDLTDGDSGLHLVIEGGNQVVVEPPAPRKMPAPAPAKPKEPSSWRQSFPLVPPDGDGTAWTPDSLQAALDQVRRKRSELQQILGLTNVDIWWSPPKAKGVPPSVPSNVRAAGAQRDQDVLHWKPGSDQRARTIRR